MGEKQQVKAGAAGNGFLGWFAILKNSKVYVYMTLGTHLLCLDPLLLLVSHAGSYRWQSVNERLRGGQPTVFLED